MNILDSDVVVGIVGSPELVQECYHSLGCRLFFLSADLHWPHYAHLRDGLRHLHASGYDDFAIILVSYISGGPLVGGAFIDVREELGADLFEHCIVVGSGGVYGVDLRRRVEWLAELSTSKVWPFRYRALSFHDRKAAAASLTHNLADLLFVRYNMEHRGAEADVFPYVTLESSPLFVFNVMHPFVFMSHKLGRSLRAIEAVDFYRYALAIPAIQGILCSFSDRMQVAEFSAARLGPMSSDEQTSFRDAYGALRVEAGSVG